MKKTTYDMYKKMLDALDLRRAVTLSAGQFEMCSFEDPLEPGKIKQAPWVERRKITTARGHRFEYKTFDVKPGENDCIARIERNGGFSIERFNDKPAATASTAAANARAKGKTVANKPASKPARESREEARQAPCREMLNDEQKKALDAMLGHGNVFVTGGAGTGKSFLTAVFKREIDKINKHETDQKTDHENAQKVTEKTIDTPAASAPAVPAAHDPAEQVQSEAIARDAEIEKMKQRIAELEASLLNREKREFPVLAQDFSALEHELESAPRIGSRMMGIRVTTELERYLRQKAEKVGLSFSKYVVSTLFRDCREEILHDFAMRRIGDPKIAEEFEKYMRGNGQISSSRPGAVN